MLVACISLLWCVPAILAASEAGQGTFDTLLDEHPVHCNTGTPITTGYTTAFEFDDKTFNVNIPPGNNNLSINFSLLGQFDSVGTLDCVFDVGGTFSATASNAAQDFQFTEIAGEYMDHKPGIGEGDPFPFTGRMRCSTTRNDDFRTLCENFDLSFNGLSKAQMETEPGTFHHFAGDFTMRAIKRADVPGGGPKVAVDAQVDGPGGSLPSVQVSLNDGVDSAGVLSVTTLADTLGTFPRGMELPVRGTTEIDHGSGAVPFFEGGDQRIVDLSTDAAIPSGSSIEVCLPLPAGSDPSSARPAYMLYGDDGGDPTQRVFVDRTRRVDPTTGRVCAKVKSLSKFAVATSDYCGKSQPKIDGLITVAGGLVGKKTVVVAGLTDCTQWPANLPNGLRRYCVPDTDSSAAECAVSITLGINRGGCNRVPAGADPHSASVDLNSYSGALKQGGNVVDLGPIFGPAIAALGAPVDATVGPIDVVLPIASKITAYKLQHQLTGATPGSSDLGTDKDVARIFCVDPTQF